MDAARIPRPEAPSQQPRIQWLAGRIKKARNERISSAKRIEYGTTVHLRRALDQLSLLDPEAPGCAACRHHRGVRASCADVARECLDARIGKARASGEKD